jgi:hypothetical protein
MIVSTAALHALHRVVDRTSEWSLRLGQSCLAERGHDVVSGCAGRLRKTLGRLNILARQCDPGPPVTILIPAALT